MYYEEVLITRLHRWIDDETALKGMKPSIILKSFCSSNDTQVLKSYLHVSKEKQAERLNERISDLPKQCKYNENDFKEATHWNEYMKAYEDCLEQCDTIPWTIIQLV